ncbi:DUF2637 domain-containing protein [Streptomyces sp. ActVer]|uniref:DUF2637 domain-containing protein n=1 Tax=Streptomyces sp. ActVer TaxID=3014558 RepID=UPI0022B359DA|nr:DUF2637 domain-containing protein [Streptomyces sp. ActVer]MCZ4510752.1 DUF2637 domain-containing protein [Streptomyces sp. ActVer]
MTKLSTSSRQDNRLDVGRPMLTKQTAEQFTLIAAGVVIVALTAGGFWLSYAHLAEVAGQHGLKNSPARQWAWPATLDAFIVAGELLMLRAGLRRVTDKGAIALTAAGSVGSIALNVAGVSGTGGTGAVPLLDYVVAAVPPTAALLAFGVLMRQIHQLVAESTDATERHNPANRSHNGARLAAVTEDGSGHPGAAGPDVADGQTDVARGSAEVAQDATNVLEPVHPSAEPKDQKPGTVSDEFLAIARTAPLGRRDRASRRHIEAAIRGEGLSIGRADAEKVKDVVQAELDEATSRRQGRT